MCVYKSMSAYIGLGLTIMRIDVNANTGPMMLACTMAKWLNAESLFRSCITHHHRKGKNVRKGGGDYKHTQLLHVQYPNSLSHGHAMPPPPLFQTIPAHPVVWSEVEEVDDTPTVMYIHEEENLITCT